MRIRLTAIIFVVALAAFSWAQAATPSKANPEQSSTATAQAKTKAECPCSKADGKAAESCCAHHQDGSAASDKSCCKGKDGKEAMSCMKGDKDKAKCCSGGSCAADGKTCCSKSDKTIERAALACCGTNGNRCGTAHRDQTDIAK
jgi:hypothetical protein